MVGFTESLNISVSVAIILQQLGARLRASEVDWRLPAEDKGVVVVGVVAEVDSADWCGGGEFFEEGDEGAGVSGGSGATPGAATGATQVPPQVPGLKSWVMIGNKVRRFAPSDGRTEITGLRLKSSGHVYDYDKGQAPVCLLKTEPCG